MTAAEPALDLFEEHRQALFGIAYRMLGSAADAEDVLQDAWLKWSAVDLGTVRTPRAYLTRIVANLSLSRLRSAVAQRESYVGPWLPEPLVTAAEPDAADGVARAEDVSLAMLVVLETLSPLERAVFILKEVFGYPYAEIAGTLGRSEASVRQVGSRARSHVRTRRPRYDAPADVRRKATDEFLAACLGGDLNEMMALLAPDVTAWTDGGGRIRAALRPLHGPEKVCRWLLGVMAKNPLPDFSARPVDVNGRPGCVILSGERVDSVLCAEVGEDGAITALRLIRNPEKLVRIRPEDWSYEA